MPQRSLVLEPCRRAQKKLEDWRTYYNEERPHGAIGNKPPPITLQDHDGAAPPS
jgi:putative transposase